MYETLCNDLFETAGRGTGIRHFHHLAIGIVLLCLRMATSLSSIPNLDVWPNYDDLLETCFT